MTSSIDDGGYVVQDPNYVAPIAEGVERTWISRNWWLPLLAALALASLLIWLANRHTTCHVDVANINISAEEENAVIAHLQEVLPADFDPEAHRAEALASARQICAAHLGGESGDVFSDTVNREFVRFYPEFHLERTDLTALGTFLTGQSWCRC